MDRDRQDTPGYQRLPRPGPRYPDDISVARPAAMAHDGGMRRVRRVSNWTAAALIAGVAATTGYFVHAGQPAAPTAGTPVGTAGTTGTAGTAPGGTAGTATAGTGAHKACPAAPVATSGGSGVTAAVPASGNCAGGSGGTTSPVWSGRDD